MGKFCTKCGSQIADADAFCPKCGASMNVDNNGTAKEQMNDKGLKQILRNNDKLVDYVKDNHGNGKVKFFVCTAIGLIIGLYVGGALISDFGIIASIIVGIMGAYDMAATIYTIISRHYIRRVLAGVFLAPMYAVFYLFVAALGGAFFFYPRAIYRLVAGQPLEVE